MTFSFDNNIGGIIEGGGQVINNQNVSITTNGIYTADEGYTGIGTATVNVPSSDFTPNPLNTAGLCLWLDGDCNTRNGLDRTKKYMENLVWNEPYSQSAGNVEITEYYNNNAWVDTNLLHCVDGYALYPQIHCTDSNELTIELVAKITETPTGSNQTLAGFGTSSKGGVVVGVSTDNKVYFYFQKAGGGGTNLNVGSVTQGDTYYHYFRAYSNGTDCGAGLTLTNTSDTRPKTHDSAYNSALSAYATASNTSTFTGGGFAVGMIRVWSRALTDSEITRNYNDAKLRFNCL